MVVEQKDQVYKVPIEKKPLLVSVDQIYAFTTCLTNTLVRSTPLMVTSQAR